MGNRSRYLGVSAAAAATLAVAARRRARRRAAAMGIRETIMPTHVVDAPSEWTMPPDPGHAPGHRHLDRHERRQLRRRGGWRRLKFDHELPYARD